MLFLDRNYYFGVKKALTMQKSNKTKYHLNSKHTWNRITHLLFKYFHLGLI